MRTRTRVSAGWMLSAAMVVLLASGASAQVLTADGAVEIALKRNTFVVNSQAELLDAQSGVQAASSGVLPQINASFTRSGSWIDGQQLGAGDLRFVSGKLISGPGTIDVESYSNSPTLQGSWNVLDLSAIKGLSSARGFASAAKLRQQTVGNEVTLETRRRFYDVVTAIHLSNVARGALRVSRDDERRVRALFDVGSVSKSDLLRAQVRTAQSELDSLTAIQNITVTRVLLAQYMGVPESDMGELDTLLVAETHVYVEHDVLTKAEQNRPDLQAAEKEVKASGSAVTAAHFRRLPYISLFGSMTFDPKDTQSATFTGVDTTGTPVSASASSVSRLDRSWQGGVAINWNIFDGLFTDSRISAAKAQQIRSREILDALRRNLISQVHGVLLVYREAVERDKVARRNVESATENLNLTQQKYNVGSSTVLDLIDAQVQLQRAQSDAISALAQLRVAEAQIERVQGGP